jgi:hypothetical protein
MHVLFECVSIYELSDINMENKIVSALIWIVPAAVVKRLSQLTKCADMDCPCSRGSTFEKVKPADK